MISRIQDCEGISENSYYVHFPVRHSQGDRLAREIYHKKQLLPFRFAYRLLHWHHLPHRLHLIAVPAAGRNPTRKILTFDLNSYQFIMTFLTPALTIKSSFLLPTCLFRDYYCLKKNVILPIKSCYLQLQCLKSKPMSHCYFHHHHHHHYHLVPRFIFYPLNCLFK